ncbi:putative membrane protein [Piscirickettsia salmonis LF-89 = ATCC VR-1361]|nr:putative membrane protein [Piscirickettsia salmonis LF-89 = ATCC VR-1361]
MSWYYNKSAVGLISNRYGELITYYSLFYIFNFLILKYIF